MLLSDWLLFFDKTIIALSEGHFEYFFTFSQNNYTCLGASGRGKVYSYTVVYSYGPTEFSEDTPYIVAVIDLQEGVRMMSNVVGCPPETAKCDMKVEVVFDDVTEEITLPKFKPVS